MAGRPRTVEIENSFVQAMMDHFKVETYVQLEEKTGIPMDNWRGWAKFRGSPLGALLTVKNLMESTGMSVDDLIEMVEKAESRQRRAS